MSLQQITSGTNDIRALLEGDEDYLRSMVFAIVRAAPEAEKGKWTSGRDPEASGTAGPGRLFLDAAVRALPAF